MNAAMRPVNRFWTPSSCSIISSARFSASSLIAGSGSPMRAVSWLIKEKPRGDGARLAGASLLDLDALLGEVLGRAGMPGHRRGGRLLVLEPDVVGFLVHAHQLVLVLEHRLHDVVGGLVVHVLVGDEQVVHRRDVVL